MKDGEQRVECWCGCGTLVKGKRCFASGHDRKAESTVIKLKYGSVAKFVADHGFGPDGENLMEALAAARKK